MSQNVYQFIDVQRVDQEKPISTRKQQFVEIYVIFAKPSRLSGDAAWIAATPIVSGSVRFIITSRSG